MQNEVPVKKPQFNARIVNLRAIAICLIVYGHSIILYSPEWSIMHTDVVSPLLHFVKSRVINPFQLNIFFAISGYLFYYNISKGVGNFFCFLRKKMSRLMIPYCLVAILWMNPIKLLLGVPGYSNYEEFIYSLKGQLLMSNSLGHLWYLPTLMGIFIICFFLYRRFSYFYVFLLGLSLWIAQTVFFIPSFFQLRNICCYLLPFSIGYAVHFLPPIHMSIYRVVTAISLGACIFFPKLEMLFVVSFLFSTFYAIPDKTNSFMETISKNSYGIYLFHSPLIYITYTFFCNESPLLVVSINFLFFGLISFFMTFLLRKTPLRIIIGEANCSNIK